MMMFNEDVACVVGVEAAVLFQNILFWIEKNIANKKNFHDGDYWTYNSTEAFAKLFPFWNSYKVRRLLETLRENDLIKTGNYNDTKYDKTLWYALTEKGKAFGKIAKSSLAEMPTGAGNDSKPIPDSNTDSKQNKKQYKTANKFADACKEIIDFINAKVGRSYQYGTESIDKLIVARLKEGYTVNDFQRVIVSKTKDWKGKEQEQYLRPSTLFAKSHFAEYLGASQEYKEPKFDEPDTEHQSDCIQQKFIRAFDLSDLVEQFKEV